MKAKELIKALRISDKLPAFDDFQVRGISCNSKEVSENFIFVAIKGTRDDGAKFIKEAADKGARFVVVPLPVNHLELPPGLPFIAVKNTRRALAELAAEFYGHPCSKIKVVGVTGTNGKTTITYLIEALLKEAGNSPAVIGTVNYRFKNKIIPAKNTTPGPIQLQFLLFEMAKAGVDFAVMEVSSHALDQERTGGIDFHSAIFTNLTQDHLDYHKNLENYFQAKAKLFQNLDSGSFAVLNYDDKYGRRLENFTRAGIISYAIEEKADLVAERIKFDCRGTRFILSLPEEKIEINTPLIGRHNIYNILAAAAWAYKSGIKPQVIKSALCGFSSLPGRLERIDGKNNFSVFVDYAHTEDALKNIITALRPLCKKKIIVVF
ncbi:MAG: UDP-N-acetylmuramoyl-L-alanyl-D-glutamate--2,6-diaminopimelate ligase, partial [Candidatus Omnitrophota bacterium]|nr:UDP-N-acetylmuramoyl-L-alanyl-D-glutamate--2,6-diaminopimelate ligase [Candidatus Omnitrophota bacterium]